jgi:hypothetical protein
MKKQKLAMQLLQKPMRLQQRRLKRLSSKKRPLRVSWRMRPCRMKRLSKM